MKIAFIGNVNSKCGIAVYNELLFKALKEFAEIKFFSERNGEEDNKYIAYCWDREEFPKLSLIEKIDEFKPDVILFSHEYGIFPKAYFFTSLVSYFRLKKYKVVTIFHSVYENHQDKLVTESICKNVVVHTDEAKRALVRKGLNEEDISIVPHGCSFANEEESILTRLWNHNGNEHVVLQAGFLFYYKSHLHMLDVIYELKKKYQNVLYIIVGSENPLCKSEHDKLYKEICDKVEKLGLTHNVVIDRGFVSKNVLMSYIRTSYACVLPYKPDPEFDVFAASGMARIVLQTSTPLLTSKANLFNNMDDVAIKCDTTDSWVKSISDIFDKKFDENKMIESRKAFLKENSWENCAKKLIDIFNIAK
jgi:glycosyltransferase involved in cell wall biosynthesis